MADSNTRVKEDEDARTRTKTAKGKQYQIEIKLKNRLSGIKALDKLSSDIEILLSESNDQKKIKDMYSLWLNQYEEILQIHDELQCLMEETESVTDGNWFKGKNSMYVDLKHAVERWFLDKKEIPALCASRDKSDTVSQTSSRTSSRASQISIAKLKESQRKVELLTRKAALEQQFELEKERLRLKIKEEELQINTELNVSNAKAKVLEDLENSMAEDQRIEDEIRFRGMPSIPPSTVPPHIASRMTSSHTPPTSYMTQPNPVMPITAQLYSPTPNGVPSTAPFPFPQFASSVPYMEPPVPQRTIPHDQLVTPSKGSVHFMSMNQPPVMTTSIASTPYMRPPHFGMESGFPPIPQPTGQTVLSPNARPFVQSAPTTTTMGQNFDEPASESLAITKYLARKDLNMARFTRFDDDPATYTAWKNSFQGIVKELKCIRPVEEIDLLIKWLGPKSSQQVLSLRTSNSYNPEAGLTRIWARLDERYGAPELIESSLRTKIAKFQRIVTKDYSRLYDILDVLSEIQSLKEDPRYESLLSYYDSSTGINPVVAKLPLHLQTKWTERATRYKVTHKVPYPPFSHFVNYISDMSSMSNAPSFKYTYEGQEGIQRKNFQTKKTTTFQTPVTSEQDRPACPIHTYASHKLSECKQFRQRPIEERKNILRENRRCFKCCEDSHTARDCDRKIKCDECGSSFHATCMHITRPPAEGHRKSNGKVQSKGQSQKSVEKHNSNSESPQACNHHDREDVNTKCTTVCGNFSGRSCAKVILVKVFPKHHPENAVEVYAILDDQSNQSLASPKLLDSLNVDSEEVNYTLSSCSGSFRMSGRRALGYTVESMDGTYKRTLPALIECPDIPDDRSEIASPDIIKHLHHLKDIPILQYRADCDIGLLLGRDIPDVHQVKEQVTGPRNSPFAQRLGLGWVIVGDVCMGNVHRPTGFEISTRKTTILQNGRGTIFEPCQNQLFVKEDATLDRNDLLFQRTKEDDKVGTSVEDRQFIAIMEREMFRNEEGNWTAPLPFRVPRLKMPNNRAMAYKRALILESSLKRNPTKKEHFVTFMSKVLSSGAAEVAPPPTGESWYLPIFGVYHPQKPDQIRGVFDSSATYDGTSLNQSLLSGPNLTNELLGILLRFRKDEVAFAADIEQMFYSFLVREDHRDFLRFFWYRDNDPSRDIIEYRMRAHVFGNSPSPAVANFGLKKSVEGQNVDQAVKELVNRNFYVDDALASVPKEDEAISLLERTQAALKDGGNIRLHKIVSNRSKVVGAFPLEDLGKELKSLKLEQDPLPTHRSLGLEWDMSTDNFIFDMEVKASDKPLTRRSMLSELNSIYDPLGFVAPVSVLGKILMRDITKGYNWDDPINPALEEKWNIFKDAVKTLKDLQIPRMMIPVSLSTANDIELHIFSDASEKAVGAVAYLKVESTEKQHTGFVMGKTKLAPSHGHTMPRLELCGAVLATELAHIIIDSLDVELKTVQYYTDSKVVLGYINNKTRRFYNYVSNRVERILKYSSPKQWNYISTKNNPADCGTRGVSSVDELQKWLEAPKILCKESDDLTHVHAEEFPLISPEDDKEIRVEVQKTGIKNIFLDNFSNKFSNWKRLVNVIKRIKEMVKNFRNRRKKHDPNDATEQVTPKSVERLLLCIHQQEHFPEEIESLRTGRSIPSASTIIRLSPILDSDGLLRVGGRLGLSCLPIGETNPIIVSNKSPISKLLVRHYHEKVKHQGRLFTEGSLRNHGLWIIGAKRLISSVLFNCVPCRKLRGKTEFQKMADLPSERLVPAPPFTNVGIDAFGPWNVVTRKTRGGSANSKRWAILFTCLGTRAVHIEVVEEMSTSSFINALRRFIAIRGNVKELRSDRGTNFVGAAHIFKDMNKMQVVNVEDEPMKEFLKNSDLVWKFNPPHSSHMGGVWERMIGMARKILDAMLMTDNLTSRNLTHEVLVTLMAEVSAIMNSRPVAGISTDPEVPHIMSPATLLTQKTSSEAMYDCADLDTKDMYREQWKRVKLLSEMFWRRWKDGYLQSLQTRRKWNQVTRDIKEGDVILLKDKNYSRMEWPVGIVVNAIKSDSDGRVRKAEVRIRKDGSDVQYVRPVNEMVMLLEN
ncbi:uncharacterized protein [Argopecten irradians]|uniref:uncharacterized protein n=1 Tax=Argopecten irradians TaxID=31199 RepID=UPI00371BEAA9